MMTGRTLTRATDDGYFYYDSKDLFYDETSPWMT